MEKKFLLVGALLLAGGFSTMNADVIYVTESGSGDGTSWSSAASLEELLVGPLPVTKFLSLRGRIRVVLS